MTAHDQPAENGSHEESLDGAGLDEALRALSHLDRRIFVRACIAEPRAAGDLAELSSLALASVSEHLKVLRKSGLLVLEKRGRFRMYRTDRAILNAIVRAVSALEERG